MVLLSLLPPSLLLLLALPSAASPAEGAALDKRFALYTTIVPDGTASAAASAETGTVATSNPKSVLSSLTLPEFVLDMVPTTYPWNVWESTDALVDPLRGNKSISVPMPGNWLGYSVEMSVANQVLGPFSYEVRAPFLNYLQNLRSRTQSGPRVRVGGNSQEGSLMYDSGGLPAKADGSAASSFLEKASLVDAVNPTNTPDVIYTKDLIYAMNNISALVGVEWMFGIAFVNDTVEGWTNPFEVALFAEETLGDNLMGLQLANEPDLYAGRRRGENYTMENWQEEMQGFFGNITAAETLPTMDSNWYMPNICCNWFPNQMLVDELQILDTFATEMKALSWQHYPYDNCGVNAGTGQLHMADYHTHATATATIAGQLNYQTYNNMAVAKGLEVVMAETNTASCSGYDGLSNAFVSALWMMDWSLTLASINFTSAYMHVGGRSATYNPFTAVQTNQSATHGWTTGPVYYTSLALAETFGSTNLSQVVDISPDYDPTLNATEKYVNNYFPAYAIYENNAPTKLAFINYISDANASQYDAVVKIGAITEGTTATTPSEVYVRYMLANSTLELYDITWAGQTASPSGQWSADGTLRGANHTVTIPCDPVALTCTIRIYAPSFALVFLTAAARDASSGVVAATQPSSSVDTTATTFPTTYDANGQGSATVAKSALETSNGRGGVGSTSLGSTSKGGSLPVSSADKAIGSSGGAGIFAWAAVVGAVGWWAATD